MIAVLPLIVGIRLLLQAVMVDIQNLPKIIIGGYICRSAGFLLDMKFS
jgi:hypothetical protein